MTPIYHRIRDERGTAMIEFALVLPILLFLALGIIDFGRAINYWNDTNQIAGDAARFAAVNKNPGATATPAVNFREWVRRQAETGELYDGSTSSGPGTSASITQPLNVCIDSPTNPKQPLTAGNPIRIRVSSSYNLIPFLGQNTQFGSVALKGSAVMRLESDFSLATPDADCS